MQLFYDIFPVFLFFITYLYFDIYVATLVTIIATGLQVIISRIYLGKWDKKQLIIFAIVLICGSLTLYLHNPIFIKWKPTVVYWIFSLIILYTHYFGKTPLFQKLTENMMPEKNKIPMLVWKKLNMFWAIFFVGLGGVNLYVAYSFSNLVWVYFKLYGVMGALLLFSILQTLYLMRYLTETGQEK